MGCDIVHVLESFESLFSQRAIIRDRGTTTTTPALTSVTTIAMVA